VQSGGGHHSWSGVLSSHGDRESPPPGTLPKTEKLVLAKHSLSCPSYSDGMFIPDEEDDVRSGAICRRLLIIFFYLFRFERLRNEG